MRKFKKNLGKITAYVVALSLCLSGVAIGSNSADAAKKPKLNKKKATLKVGQKLKLKVKNTSVKASKLKWKSSKKKVAKVNKKGKVTALKKGKTVISVKVNGVKLKCKITVKKKGSATATPTATTAATKAAIVTAKPSTQVAIATSANPASSTAPNALNTVSPVNPSNTVSPSDSASPTETTAPEENSKDFTISNDLPDYSKKVSRSEQIIDEYGSRADNYFDDDNNLRVEVFYTEYGCVSITCLTNYDENGNIVLELTYDSANKLSTITETNYDTDGNPVHKTNYDVTRGKKVLYYEREINGNKEHTVYYTPNGNVESDSQATRNDQGYVISEVETDSSGQTYTWSYEYVFDEDGHMLKETDSCTETGNVYVYEKKWKDNKLVEEYNSVNDIPSEKYVYKYDSDGILVEQQNYYYDEYNETLYITSKNTYDFNNHIETLESYTDNVLSSKSVTEYNSDGTIAKTVEQNYDSTGNVEYKRVETSTYEDDSVISCIEEYYQDSENKEELVLSNKENTIRTYNEFEYLTYEDCTTFNLDDDVMKENSHVILSCEYEYSDDYGTIATATTTYYESDGTTVSSIQIDEYSEDGSYTSTSYNADNKITYQAYYDEYSSLLKTVDYYVSGNISCINIYNSSEVVAECKEYYDNENNTIYSVTTYFEDTEITHTYIQYYESGKVKYEIEYDDGGDVISEKNYDEDGDEIVG